MTNATQPKIDHPNAVQQYAKQVMEMRAMVANLAEFLDSLPAPDENEDVVGIDYAGLGSLNEMHGHMVAASEISSEMFE